MTRTRASSSPDPRLVAAQAAVSSAQLDVAEAQIRMAEAQEIAVVAVADAQEALAARMQDLAAVQAQIDRERPLWRRVVEGLRGKSDAS